MVLTLSVSHCTAGQMRAAAMTQQEAIDILHSKSARPDGAVFVVLREIQGDSETKRLAELSTQAANSLRIKPLLQGVFLDVMETNGFVVVEVDPRSNNAVRLHLVTRRPDGGEVVESAEIEGQITAAEASELSRKSEAVTGELLSFSSSEYAQLARLFVGGQFPHHVDGEPPGSYFSIPESVLRLNEEPRQLEVIAGLTGAIDLWPFRHALSSVIYPADLIQALKEARQRQDELTKAFLEANGQEFEFVYELRDLANIGSAAELTDRLDWLSRLNAFLEQHSSLGDNPPLFKMNRLLSTIPLEIGTVERGEQRIYSVMTASGLIFNWARDPSGQFQLIAISEAE